jgi:hypothetical protein
MKKVVTIIIVALLFAVWVNAQVIPVDIKKIFAALDNKNSSTGMYGTIARAMKEWKSATVRDTSIQLTKEDWERMIKESEADTVHYSGNIFTAMVYELGHNDVLQHVTAEQLEHFYKPDTPVYQDSLSKKKPEQSNNLNKFNKQ